MKTIQILYNKSVKRVLAELAFVGKRQQVVKGDPAFSITTFSTAEEAVVESAVASAVLLFIKEMKEYIVNYNTTIDSSSHDKITGVKFSIENIRADDFTWGVLEQILQSFVVSYATATILAKTSPDLAKAYADEANASLQAAVSIVINKKPVENPLYTTTDMKGSVTIEDDEDFIETFR